MKRAIAVALVCAASVALAEPADHQTEVADKVKAALAHRDAGALAAQLAAPLTYEGLVVRAQECNDFGAAGTVAKKDLAAFAGCLVAIADAIDVRVSVDRGATAATRVTIAARGDADPAADAVAATLAAAIHAGEAKAVAAALAPPFYYGGLVTRDDACKQSFRVSGAVEDAKDLEPFATCLLAVDGISDYGVAGHLFPPHHPGAEHAVNVYVDPDSHAIRFLSITPKRDPNAPPVVAPQILNGNRISGDPAIRPDDKTATAILKSGKRRVIASVKMCLDKRGKVTLAEIVKSSGFAAYDQELTDGVRTWKYKPWTVDGKPVLVCTAITFIYQQH